MRQLFGAARIDADPVFALEDSALRKTPTHRFLRPLIEYGIAGGTLNFDLHTTLERLLPALRKLYALGYLNSASAELGKARMIADLAELITDIDTFAFDSELGAAIVAAWARAQLEQDLPLTATQLAVLAGVGSVAIGNAIRAGSLKAAKRARDQAQKRGNPYVIQPAEVRRYLGARDVPLTHATE
ncbi:MAG: hypothetical protein JWN04_6530 [Myxococcaceae bacterium]|nr:hypothetical protein [Myxococcaceae bacterium]